MYLEEMGKGNIDSGSGVHTVFGLVFVPLFCKAIDEGNMHLLKSMSKFVEAMEMSSDTLVQEVSGFIVIESLCDLYDDSVLDRNFLQEGKSTLKRIRKWIV